MFLTGARLFSGSFESAIYLLSSICTIPPNVSVLPAINTNFSHHICAGLANGDTIPGQNAISHPSEPTALPSSYGTPAPSPLRPLSPSPVIPEIRIQSHTSSSTSSQLVSFSDPFPHDLDFETVTADTIEDANLPGSLPTLRKGYLTFSKSPSHPQPQTSHHPSHHHPTTDLPARITRLWYINPYGQEIRLSCNPKIPTAIDASNSIIYCIGSLYTSVIPSLILRGVGDAIARRSGVPKILILNGSLDRETRASNYAFSAADFVRAVARACVESRGVFGREATAKEVAEFVTHVVYVEGEGTPKVSREELATWGVEAVRVYGRKDVGGEGCRYDLNALRQTLEALVGRREVGGGGPRRRYTLES